MLQWQGALKGCAPLFYAEEGRQAEGRSGSLRPNPFHFRTSSERPGASGSSAWTKASTCSCGSKGWGGGRSRFLGCGLLETGLPSCRLPRQCRGEEHLAHLVAPAPGKGLIYAVVAFCGCTTRLSRAGRISTGEPWLHESHQWREEVLSRFRCPHSSQTKISVLMDGRITLVGQ